MSSWVKQAVTAAAVASAIGTTVPALAAVDVFIKIAEIKGETQDAKHKGEIDALSWSWGTSQTVVASAGRGNATAGRAVPKDLVITKVVDSTSPAFVQYANSGKPLAEVQLTVRLAGGKGTLEYIRLKLKDVIVTSVKISSQGGQNPTEEISLAYNAIEYSVATPSPAGTLGAAVVTTFNFATMKP